jgi:large subunit ribosomal protein L6
MSRVGKKPIALPKGVESVSQGDLLTIKGPKGRLERRIPPGIVLQVEQDKITLATVGEPKAFGAQHGLMRALVANMVRGVTTGFERALDIVGIGYRAELNGRTVVLHLGYSHPIHFDLPEGIDAKIEKTRITLSGIDKEKLGLTAAKMRSFRRPEPYKGKGIKYAEETLRRKAGKSGSK